MFTIEILNKTDFIAVTMDISEIGGPMNLQVDPDLMEQTISDSDSTSVGLTAISILIEDSFGRNYTKESLVEIEARELIVTLIGMRQSSILC